MLFKTIKGFKQVFRKGNENWAMRKLFDQERPVITVAQDGSGDFQKIEDALRIATQLSGAYIQIKKGAYYPVASSTTQKLLIPSNTKLEGDGESTIIYLDAFRAGEGNSKSLDFLNKSNIILKDIQFLQQGDGETVGEFNIMFGLEGSTNIKLDGIIFDVTGALLEYPSHFLKLNATSSNIIFDKCEMRTAHIDSAIIGTAGYTKLSIINSKLSSLGSDISGSNLIIKGNTLLGSCQIHCSESSIEGNLQIYLIQLYAGSIKNTIKGNYCRNTIQLDAGANYNNVTGNIVDLAVSDAGTGNTVANNTVY